MGAQLNWSAREKECYGLYYGVKLFEAELDGRYFILATDHLNLTYINTVLTGKVLRWKLYLQDKNCDVTYVQGKSKRQFVLIAAVREQHPPAANSGHVGYGFSQTPVHISTVRHWGLLIYKKRLAVAQLNE